MMGVVAIQPVVTTRSEVALASLRRRRRQERWQRISVSSAKQCGRAVVPMVFEPRAFEEVAAALDDALAPGQILMFVEPSASARVVPFGDLGAKPPRATILVGPEGGWTPAEVMRGSASARLVTLGSRTLRADAMALVALTALLVLWREF
jgi:16S rRNA (uracil1498-N3)-methyltransferase